MVLVRIAGAVKLTLVAEPSLRVHGNPCLTIATAPIEEAIPGERIPARPVAAGRIRDLTVVLLVPAARPARDRRTIGRGVQIRDDLRQVNAKLVEDLVVLVVVGIRTWARASDLNERLAYLEIRIR